MKQRPPCPNCKGEKVIRCGLLHPDGTFEDSMPPIECPDCLGTGKDYRSRTDEQPLNGSCKPTEVKRIEESHGNK